MISLNQAHPLAGSVRSLVAADPDSLALVDLARPAATFVKGAGTTVSKNAAGVGVVSVTGTDAGNKSGFTFTPALTSQSQVAGFSGTVLLVSKFVRGDANLPNYKVTMPIGGAGDLICQPMPVIAQGYGNVACVQSFSGDNYAAEKASTVAQAGQVHSLAVTASNAAGGWHSVAGALFVDGVSTGVAVTGDGGDFSISGFNGLANSLWVGDLLYLVFFNRVLTAAEIAELSSSVSDTGRLSLVTGYSAAPAPSAPPAPGLTLKSKGAASAIIGVTLAAGATGEYSVNGGAVVAYSGGDIVLSGLGSGLNYTLSMAAVKDGLRSATASIGFTTDSSIGGGGTTGATSTTTVPVPGSVTVQVLRWSGVAWVPTDLAVVSHGKAWVPAKIEAKE